jgi:hypothetical protein
MPKPENIHEYFSLSYASWLVLPRVILEAMPEDWQRQFVEMLDQVNETFDWCPQDLSFQVIGRQRGRLTSLPEVLCSYRHPVRKDIEALRCDGKISGR